MNRIYSLLCFLLLSLVAGAQNVGVGTNTPAFPLDINGRTRIRHTPGLTPGIWYNKADNTASAFVGLLNDTTFGIHHGEAASWRFMFDYKNTNLGIGTFSPQHPLTFASTTGDKISLWGGNIPNGDHYGFGVQGSLMQVFVPNSVADIAFGTGRSDAFTERFRFTGDGRLGVGTNNPTYPITVAVAGGGAGIIHQNTSNGITLGTYVGADAGWLQTVTNHPLYFATNNGAAQVTLATNGFLGIGTTNPVTRLDIYKGRLRFTGNVSAGAAHGIEFTNNAGTLARGFIGMIDDASMGFFGYGNNQWGLQYNVVTGNVGIGTTPSSDKLTVNGKLSADDFQLADGTQGFGYTLSSDGVGNANWQAPVSFKAHMAGMSLIVGSSTPGPSIFTLINVEYQSMPGLINTATNSIDIPVTGFYHLDAEVAFTTSVEHGSVTIAFRTNAINGPVLGTATGFPINKDIAHDKNKMVISCNAFLTAGTKVYLIGDHFSEATTFLHHSPSHPGTNTTQYNAISGYLINR